MRMVSEQIDFLKAEALSIVPEALIYLFGSRVDDHKKGGDIDIMVLSNKGLNWKDKARIRWNFCKRFGEQKLDIISFTFEEESPFKQIVLSEGVRL